MAFSFLCQSKLVKLQCAHPALPDPHLPTLTDGSNHFPRCTSPPALSLSLCSCVTDSCQKLTPCRDISSLLILITWILLVMLISVVFLLCSNHYFWQQQDCAELHYKTCTSLLFAILRVAAVRLLLALQNYRFLFF